MYKLFIFFLMGAGIASCASNNKEAALDPATETPVINTLLDSFNVAAANADFEKYFSYYADDAVFAGTDALEYWDIPAFKAYAKPYFDAGKAWSFTSVKRNVYFDNGSRIAWFDETLDTQMELCRGSGVLEKIGDTWKIKQYILSITLPNNLIDSVVQMKKPFEFVQKKELESQ